MRKKLVPAVGVLALAATRVSAQLVYEPFDYGTASVGTNLGHTSTGVPDPFTGYLNPMVGQTWFDVQTGVGTGTPHELMISSGNLVPGYTSALAPATGNGVTFNVSTSASRPALLAVAPTGVTSGTTYYSFTLRIDDLTNAPVGTAGAFFAGLTPNTGTTTTNVGTVGARLHIRRDTADSTKFNLGIKSNTNTNTLGITYDYLADTNSASGAALFNVADSIFIVGSYTFGAGAGDDVSALWINPAATSFGAGTAPARGAGVSGITDMAVNGGADANFDSSGIGSIMLRQGNTLIPQGISVDELRVDTTWAGVTAPKGTTWAGTSGANWSSNSNWDTTLAPSGAAQFVNFNAGGGTVNIDSPQTVGTLNIKSTSGYTLSGSTLTLNGDTNGQGNINVYAVMDATGGPPSGTALASSHTISAPIDMATNSAMNIALNQTLTISSVISGTGTSLSKNGGGTLILTNTNTFTGGLKIGNGIVQVSSDGNLGGAGGGITLARGRLQATANLNIDAARVIQIAGPGNTTGVGIIDTNGFNVSVPGQIIGTNFSTFTNVGSLTKAGAGTLTLSNTTNSYTGSFITGGTLAVNVDANLGTVPATANTNITFSNNGVLKWLSRLQP
jgi:autotransporter-associated beta strand protein